VAPGSIADSPSKANEPAAPPKEIAALERDRSHVELPTSIQSKLKPKAPLNAMRLGRASAFIENRGQFDRRVRFQMKGSGQTLWLTDHRIVFDSIRSKEESNRKPQSRFPDSRERLAAPRRIERLVFTEDFVDARKSSAVEAGHPLPGLYNYFIGNDPKKWRTDVPGYAEVTYRNVWDGVDLKLYRNGANLEQEFIVQPGSDLSKVRVSFKGIEDLKIAADGSLLIQTAFGDIRETQPRIYQEISGKRTAVDGRFKLIYSTYLGGSVADSAAAVAVDSGGMAYVAGSTSSPDFPVTLGAYQTKLNRGATTGNTDAFVAKLKLNASGAASLIYATYLGGDQNDEAVSIAVDDMKNAYVTGGTHGNATIPFPITTGAVQTTYLTGDFNAFVSKLNATGNSLVYSTFMGAGGGRAIAADALGNAYITGINVASFVTPTPDAAQPNYGGGRSDGFVTKLDPGGALIYASFLGGLSDEDSLGIEIDAAGDAYVTGYTASVNFPVTLGAFQQKINPGGTNGPEDAFVTKFPLGGQFRILQVTPNNGGNGGQVTVTIFGTGMHNGMNLELTGPSSISASNVVVSTFGRITTATFDLQRASVVPGAYNLAASNPDGSTATIPGAFTVVQGGSPQLWIDIVGPSVFRIGNVRTYQTYTLDYGNNGNIDAGSTVISLSYPPVLTATPIAPPGSVTNDLDEDGNAILSITIPSLPVGSSRVVTLQLSLPNPSSVAPHQDFQLVAFADLLSPQSAVNSSGSVAKVPRKPCNLIKLCANVYDGTRECTLRQGLEALGLYVNSCPCDFACQFVCYPVKSLRPTSCLFGCTDVARMTQFALSQLVRFAQAVGPCPNFTLSGGSECDNHTRGPCGHFRGYSVDLESDYDNTTNRYQNTCLTKFIRANPFFPHIKFLQESDHWHLQFPDHRGTCDDSVPLFDQFVVAGDPNDKAGSIGQGPQQYLSGQQPLTYSIFFENLATASAPAQQVTITDLLDTANIDLTTLRLGPIVFGNTSVIPPPDSMQYSTNVDLRPAPNLIIGVSAKLDSTKGVLTWNFVSLDGTTGLPTADPSSGFLPPNLMPPQGQGAVFFTVKPKKALATNTQIQNQATVIFDALAPIATQTWLNTIDNTYPASQVSALPPLETSPDFQVTWSGADVGSGVKDFTIYVSDNGGPFTPFVANTVVTSATYPGVIGHTYGFFSQARDLVDNVEALKSKAETTTTIVKGGPPVAKCTNVTVPTDPGVCTASNASVDNGSSDPDGDAVTVSQTPAGPYPLGTTAVTLTATDTETLSSTCSANVTVVDKQPPTISTVSASPNVIWPPNEKMIPVTVSVSASENCDPSPVCKITGITSNESISSSDAQITGNLTASLRAERLGSGTGRTYTLAIQCTDASSNSSAANGTVTVPHDQGS
jgi:hypothetical protein